MERGLKIKIFLGNLMVVTLVSLIFLIPMEIINSKYPVYQVYQLPNGTTGFIDNGRIYEIDCRKLPPSDYQVYLKDEIDGESVIKMTCPAGVKGIIGRIILYLVATTPVLMLYYCESHGLCVAKVLGEKFILKSLFRVALIVFVLKVGLHWI